MNPEHEFTLLRDESLWKVEPPTVRVAKNRRRGRILALAVPAFAAIIIGILVVVGVSGLRATMKTLPAVPEPVTTSSPTPTPSVVWETPSQPIPGSPVTTPLSEPLTQTFDGSQTVDLGERPAGANAFTYELACLTAGGITFADGGAGMNCSSEAIATGQASMESAEPPELPAGVHDVKMHADPDMRWSITTTWVESHLSPLGVNANGQTYGAAGHQGSHPDLIATYASNGRSGYSYAKDHHGVNSGCAESDAVAQQRCMTDFENSLPPILVYESDGTTVIGQMLSSSAGTPISSTSTP